MRRIYKLLLRLYPDGHRTRFAAEMLNAFDQAADERRNQGWRVWVRFGLCELAGLVIGAGTEWMIKLMGRRSVEGRSLAATECTNPGQSALPCEVMESRMRVTVLVDRIVHAIAHHDFAGARSFSYQERTERENLRLLREKYNINE